MTALQFRKHSNPAVYFRLRRNPLCFPFCSGSGEVEPEAAATGAERKTLIRSTGVEDKMIAGSFTVI